MAPKMALLNEYLAKRRLELCEADFAVNHAKVETEEAGADGELKKGQRPRWADVVNSDDSRADVADSDEGHVELEVCDTVVHADAVGTSFKPVDRRRKRKKKYRNLNEAA